MNQNLNQVSGMQIVDETNLSPYYFVFCMLTWVAAPTFLLIFALCQDQKWKDCCEYFEFVIWALIAFMPSFLFVYLILPYSAIYYGVLGLCHTEQGNSLRGIDKKTLRRNGNFISFQRHTFYKKTKWFQISVFL